jgi:hypothetical protein
VSSFYSPYDQVFARWTPEQLEAARYSCPNFARAQGRHYRVAALRSERAVRVLRGLHEVAEGYARWVLRALHWLALPASFVLILRRRGGAPYVWLTTLIVASHAVRAVSVYADERYQLPVDLLTVAWLMLTLRLALDRAATSARAVGSRPASEG